MDVSFSLGVDGGKRNAFRARVPGLTVNVEGRPHDYMVKDISASGLAVLDEERSFAEGEVVHLDLLINKRVYLRTVKGEVIRVLDNGIVGVNFLELNRRQEARLDKLVLEVQKRLINMRKAKESTEKK